MASTRSDAGARRPLDDVGSGEVSARGGKPLRPTKHFLTKLYAGYVALILITAGIVGVLTGTRVEDAALQDVDLQLETAVHLLNDLAGDALAHGMPEEEARAELQERLQDLGRILETRLTVIAEDGTVLAESELDPALMGDHSNREEIVEALDSGLGAAIRRSESTQQQMRYLAVPWVHRGNRLGAVRAAMPLTIVEERRREVLGAVFLGVTVASAVALLLGFLLARRFTMPLREMAEQAHSIASTGAYGQRVPVRSSDEFGRLAKAFNTMSENLRSSLTTIYADRNKLTAILASMAEGVVAIDRDERVVHMNQVAGEILETDPEEAHGRPIWEVSRVREVSEALNEALRREEGEERVVRRPGLQDRYLEIHTSPLRTGARRTDQIAGAVVVLADVTRLRRLESIRRDFVGNVSHEIKTPVAAIRGMVETLLDDPDAPPEVLRRFLTRIEAQSERLAVLIQDLLALTRLEAEERPLELAPIELSPVLKSCLEAHRPSAEVRDVELRCACVLAEDAVVQAEEEGVLQAVGNLLSNAIKYSPAGEAVELRTRREDDWIVVEVSDKGPGIEPRHHERLFERFYRVDAARSRRLGGTGLGLAIVKHTMLAFGGDVGVESLPGEGSTFSLRFPASSLSV